MKSRVRRLLWEQEIAGSSPAVPTSKRPPHGGRFSLPPSCGQRFSAGPSRKRPGWTPEVLKDAAVGRSHRSALGKAKLKELRKNPHKTDGFFSILKVPGCIQQGLVCVLEQRDLRHLPSSTVSLNVFSGGSHGYRNNIEMLSDEVELFYSIVKDLAKALI